MRTIVHAVAGSWLAAVALLLLGFGTTVRAQPITVQMEIIGEVGYGTLDNYEAWSSNQAGNLQKGWFAVDRRRGWRHVLTPDLVNNEMGRLSGAVWVEYEDGTQTRVKLVPVSGRLSFRESVSAHVTAAGAVSNTRANWHNAMAVNGRAPAGTLTGKEMVTASQAASIRLTARNVGALLNGNPVRPATHLPLDSWVFRAVSSLAGQSTAIGTGMVDFPSSNRATGRLFSTPTQAVTRGASIIARTDAKWQSPWESRTGGFGSFVATIGRGVRPPVLTMSMRNRHSVGMGSSFLPDKAALSGQATLKLPDLTAKNNVQVSQRLRMARFSTPQASFSARVTHDPRFFLLID
jgi:hypothetical protein